MRPFEVAQCNFVEAINCTFLRLRGLEGRGLRQPKVLTSMDIVEAHEREVTFRHTDVGTMVFMPDTVSEVENERDFAERKDQVVVVDWVVE